MEKKLQHLKRIVGGLDDMYKSMASSLGNRVKCDTCKREKQVDSVKCLQSGWPKCCGYTMTLLSPDKIGIILKFLKHKALQMKLPVLNRKWDKIDLNWVSRSERG